MRVIQWMTGSVGRTTLRRVIDLPHLELVGLYVSNPAKVGVDAGAIAKRPTTGVTATDDIERILATDADIVIHVPLISVPYDRQNENVIRLLASGKNVVSTNGFYRPTIHGDAYSGPLLAAALKGGVTLAGTGLNPGFIAERLALTLSGMMARLDSILCREVFDASQSTSPGLLFDAMGFGADPTVTDLTASHLSHMYDQYYAELIHDIAIKLGTTVRSIESRHEVTPAPHDITLKAGVIHCGCVAATTWRWVGTYENGVRMVHEILWTAEHRLHDVSDEAHWVIELKGRPDVRANIVLTDPDPDAPASRPPMDATAATIINLLPSIVAAKPGFFELPALVPYGSAH